MTIHQQELVDEVSETEFEIFITPRTLYSKLKLSKRFLSDHFMPVHWRQIEKLITNWWPSQISSSISEKLKNSRGKLAHQKEHGIIITSLDEQINGEESIAALRTAKEELESMLSQEKSQSQQLKQELAEIESRNTELYKKLQSIRGQLATAQSRCFKLEVSVAKLRQKLQMMESLQKELELLQRQKAGSEEASCLYRLDLLLMFTSPKIE